MGVFVDSHLVLDILKLVLSLLSAYSAFIKFVLGTYLILD